MMPDQSQSIFFTCIMHDRLLEYYGTIFSWHPTGPGAGTIIVLQYCTTYLVIDRTVVT
eukprot:COSAG05_NODE_295_length_11962_cov_6.608952_7_plen_58_part_00